MLPFHQEISITVNFKANRLIVISAPSGAGKTTLCQKLLSDFPSIVLSISSTSRAPRGTEKNGVEYFFLSREGFEKKIKDGQFAEWALVHGNYYGTSKEVIQNTLTSGRSVLLDIDVQGAEQLYKSFPEETYRIFISPPNIQELEFRLRARKTETEENIRKRLQNAELEIAESEKFDKVIVNDSLERAYQELKETLQNQLQIHS
jgi:guanylate kinase